MLTQLINIMIYGLGGFGKGAVALLPYSPFQYIEGMIGVNPFMDLVLWIVPVHFAFSIFTAWLASIFAYYLVKVPARWVKVVKG